MPFTAVPANIHPPYTEGDDIICTIKLVDPTSAMVLGRFPLDVVKAATSFVVTGYMFMPRYRKRVEGKRVWDGKHEMLSRPYNTFPPGLVPGVTSALQQYAAAEGIKCNVQFNDEIEYPRPLFNGTDVLPVGAVQELRDYQLEAVAKVLEHKRGVLKMATNSGKTALTAAIVKHIGLSSVVFVPSIELLYQTSDKLSEFLGEPVGLIGDGKWVEERVTVAMPTTVLARLKKDINKKIKAVAFLKNQDVMILDECHKAGAAGVYKVLKQCTAAFRIGMSGTPLDRSDGADLRLISQTGEVIYEITNKYLVDHGYSSTAAIKFFKVEEPVQGPAPPGTDQKDAYRAAYAKGVVFNAYRNDIVCHAAEKAVKEGKSVLILVNRRPHGELLHKQLDCKSIYLSGTDSTKEEREDGLKAFKTKAVPVLVATSIMDTGVDIPVIDMLILAGGEKAKIRTLQRLGRGLRVGGLTNHVEVVEFMDLGHKALATHSLTRFIDYKKEDTFEILEASREDYPAMSEFSAFKLKYENCTECELCETRKAPVFGRGASPIGPTDMVFLGDFPKKEDEKAQAAFTSPDGVLLNKTLRDSELTVGKKWYMLNLLMCNTVRNVLPKLYQIDACKTRLYEHLTLLDPNVIVLLGDPAAQAILLDSYVKGQFEYEQEILGRVRKLYVVKHPKWVATHGGIASEEHLKYLSAFKGIHAKAFAE